MDHFLGAYCVLIPLNFLSFCKTAAQAFKTLDRLWRVALGEISCAEEMQEFAVGPI